MVTWSVGSIVSAYVDTALEIAVLMKQQEDVALLTLHEKQVYRQSS
jgi:hypothetical protein